MLLISETYEVVTQESAEHGEAEDLGFNFEDQAMEFRDLVSTLKWEYRGGEASCYPLTESMARHAWITSGADQDYKTGEYKTTSLHFSSSNPDRKAKYWSKALRAAGFIKGEG